MEHADLPDLSPVCGAGGHPCVFDRRGIHGCYGISGNLQGFAARAGKAHHPHGVRGNGHHGDGGDRDESVSVQGGDGYCGEARGSEQGRRADCRAG